MRDAIPPNPAGLARSGFTCQACGNLNVTAVDGLFTTTSRGSRQRFCNPACRQAAYRRRRAEVAENTPRQHTGGRTRRLTKNPK